MAEPEEIVSSGSLKEKTEGQNNIIKNEELFPDEISEVQQIESDLNTPLIEMKNLESFHKDELIEDEEKSRKQSLNLDLIKNKDDQEEAILRKSLKNLKILTNFNRLNDENNENFRHHDRSGNDSQSQNNDNQAIKAPIILANQNINNNKRLSQKKNHSNDNKSEEDNLGRILTIAKKTRQKTELEAQILANRIALLKQEELKTLKKIKETQTKTEEIYKIKKINFEKNAEREKQLKTSKEFHTSIFRNFKEKNEKRKEAVSTKKEQLMERKINEHKIIKQESQKNELKKKDFLIRVYNNNLAKNHFIKTQKSVGGMRIEEFRSSKLLYGKRIYEDKIQEENKKAKKSEEEILEMEKMEIELIRKLQESQLLQKNIYEELEGVLTLPLLEYEGRFRGKEEKKKKKKKVKKKDVREESMKKTLNQYFRI